jgi:hypothetical protein
MEDVDVSAKQTLAILLSKMGKDEICGLSVT